MRAVGIVIVLGAAMGAPGYAQTLPDRGFKAVDQTVGDTDPRARDLRKVEPGIGRSGGQASYVYRKKGSDKLFYVDQGFVAEYDRSQYSWIYFKREKRWKLYQFIPPNTVFHLDFPRPPVAAEEDTNEIRQRLKSPVPPPHRSEGTIDPTADEEVRWRRYRSMCQAQRRTVLETLDPGVPNPSSNANAPTD